VISQFHCDNIERDRHIVYQFSKNWLLNFSKVISLHGIVIVSVVTLAAEIQEERLFFGLDDVKMVSLFEYLTKPKPTS